MKKKNSKLTKKTKSEKEIPTPNQEKRGNEKPTLSDAKIKKLLDFEHIEELYFLLGILSDKDIDTFIAHYKGATVGPTREARLDTLIKNAAKSYDLAHAIRDELAKRLLDEYDEIRGEMRVYRKKGIDVFVEDVVSMQIPLKVRLFKATGKKEDFYKVKKMLGATKEKLLVQKEAYTKLEQERKTKEEAQKKHEEEERLKKQAQESNQTKQKKETPKRLKENTYKSLKHPQKASKKKR